MTAAHPWLWSLASLLAGGVMASLLLRLLRVRQPWLGVPLVLMVLALSLWSGPWGLGGWLRSYLGEFSLTLGVLACLFILQRLGGPVVMPPRQLRTLCWLVVGTAVWFYPMSLGATYMDPYAWGFGHLGFSAVLLALGLVACWRGAYGLCLMLVAAQCAYGLRLLPSDNLWDYLLDPVLTVWCAGWLVRDGWRRQARHQAQHPARA